MVDYPEQTGKMCDWNTVTEVMGAGNALRYLSEKHSVYIATGAADSTVKDICAALERVKLSQYIAGCFCPSNLGVGKDSPQYFDLIVEKLNVSPSSITMVGDSYCRDILPALNAGLHAIWYNPENTASANSVRSIRNLNELCV